jgi:hypothetical protein
VWASSEPEIIALAANIAAKEGRPIEFQPEWFDPDSDETPEGVRPNYSGST